MRVARVSWGEMDKTEKSYHKLIVWHKIQDLLILTYKLTEKLPDSEKFGLISQMRRAVVSSVCNLVEGYLRKSKKEKGRFLEIAETSLLELEAQSEICLILGYWSKDEYQIFDKKRSLSSYFLHKYKEKVLSS